MIVVSMDDPDTYQVLRDAAARVETTNPIVFWEFELPFAKSAYKGEPGIARHMRAAFNRAFKTEEFEYIIFVENDLVVSSDFFEYMERTGTLLSPAHPASAGIFCVSGWNDQGYRELKLDESKMLRSEFYPGLGVLFHKSFWLNKMENEWPMWLARIWGYDHWVRYESKILRGLDCLLPEVSRTHHIATHGMHVDTNAQAFYYDRMVLASGNTLVSEEWAKRVADPIANRAAMKANMDGADFIDAPNANAQIMMDKYRDGKVVVLYHNNPKPVDDIPRDTMELATLFNRFNLFTNLERSFFRGAFAFTHKPSNTIVTLVNRDNLDYWKAEL